MMIRPSSYSLKIFPTETKQTCGKKHTRKENERSQKPKEDEKPVVVFCFQYPTLFAWYGKSLV